MEYENEINGFGIPLVYHYDIINISLPKVYRFFFPSFTEFILNELKHNDCHAYLFMSIYLGKWS